MNTYRMPPDGLQQAKRDYLRHTARYAWIFAFVAAALISIFQDRSQGLSLTTYAMLFVGFFLFFGICIQFGLRLRLPQIQNAWGSYQVTLREQVISMQQANVAEIVIRREEVERIEESRDGDLVVKGRLPGQAVIVPAKIEGYSEIRAQLSQWQPIMQGIKPSRDTYLVAAFVIFMLISIGMRVTTDPFIVFPLGLISLGGIGYCAFRILSIPTVKGRVRWGWIGLTTLGVLSSLLQMVLVAVLMIRG